MLAKFRIFVILTIISFCLAACASGGNSSNDVVQAQSVDQDTQTIAQQVEPSATPAVDTAPTTGAAPESALPLTDDNQQMIATVNGDPILLTEFESTFERSLMQTESASYSAVASAVLNTLIEQKLISQAAVELGIAVSDEEVENEFQETRALLPDDQAWQTWLIQNELTEEQLRRSLYIDLLTRKVVDAVTEPETLTVDEVHARHILVSTLDEANAVLARLQGGEDFGTVAEEVSRDVTTQHQGGDLGWFTRDGLLTPELAEAAFALEPNQIGGPIVTMLGYHIVQTLEITQRAARLEEEAKAINTQFTEWLQSRRAAASIEQFIEF